MIANPGLLPLLAAAVALACTNKAAPRRGPADASGAGGGAGGPLSATFSAQRCGECHNLM
jgi:hypothetical protein